MEWMDKITGVISSLLNNQVHEQVKQHSDSGLCEFNGVHRQTDEFASSLYNFVPIKGNDTVLKSNSFV